MSTLIFWATISIFFSFLCSILEAVLLSVTSTFINVKKQEGKDYALTLETLKKDVDKPLIAILTLNTIAHTLGAMMVGIEAEKLPFKIELFGINTVGVVSAIMTFLILVASEIIPKIIGGKGHGSILSREGFLVMADMAHEEGVFQENESKIIKNLLTFKEVFAKDAMTPRTVMQAEDQNTTVKDFFNRNLNLRFSRIPIYSKNPDNIKGLVLKDEIFKEMALGNGDKKLSELKRNIIIIDRNLPIPNLFEQLIESRNHMALVVDEYGSVSGLVTMEDVIETLLGLEIMDESDNVSDLQHLARKSWEARAKKLGIFDDNTTSE